MAIFDTIRLPEVAEAIDQVTETITVAEIQRHLDGANLTVEHLRESMADLELALEDRGWQRLGLWADQQFSRAGLDRAALLCRAMIVANPLIRRGINLRTAYVWAGGVQIAAKAQGGDDGEQDVNTVIQTFLDDVETRKQLTGAGARERNERTLGSDGNLFVALFTAPTTGSVRPRLLPLTEIADIVKNPEDRTEPWFYKRVACDLAGHTTTTYHPDIDYQPAARVTRLGGAVYPQQAVTVGDQVLEPGAVLWDAPVIHVKVNDLADWDFGIGDAFAAIAWARLYDDFLRNWAKLMAALSRFAFRLAPDRKTAAQAAAARLRQKPPTDSGRPSYASNPVDDAAPVGQTWVGTGANLEAIPKSGAVIDSGSGKPIAAMVASSMDVPVTMLLADPGQTGARAVAETLDAPTENMAAMRRDLWSEFLRRMCDYLIDASVKAPRGVLHGTVARDEWGRTVVTLDGDTSRAIEISWPDLTQTPVNVLMQAIEMADGMNVLDPLVVLKLVLAALHVSDADEIVEAATGEDGKFLPPTTPPSPAALQTYQGGAVAPSPSVR